jgi:hypothetical protein
MEPVGYKVKIIAASIMTKMRTDATANHDNGLGSAEERTASTT